MNTVFYSCIAQVLVLLLLVSLVISIYQQIKGIKEENSALIWSIVTTVISVLLMVISTVVSLAFKSTVKVSGQMAEVGISVSLAKQWITLIFAILYMVLCIIQKILKNNAKTKE